MILFINYNKKENDFIVSGLLDCVDGAIPIECKEISLSNHPYLLAKLMEGKIVYIDSFDCYLGTRKTEGPYCEQEIFDSEYESHNNEVTELLINIDRNIREKKKNIKKLVKIGNHYIQ